MIETSNLILEPEIREGMKQLHEESLKNIWAKFKKRLRNEYFNEDSERMSKRGFLDWIEQ